MMATQAQLEQLGLQAQAAQQAQLELAELLTSKARLLVLLV